MIVDKIRNRSGSAVALRILAMCVAVSGFIALAAGVVAHACASSVAGSGGGFGVSVGVMMHRLSQDLVWRSRAQQEWYWQQGLQCGR